MTSFLFVRVGAFTANGSVLRVLYALRSSHIYLFIGFLRPALFRIVTLICNCTSVPSLPECSTRLPETCWIPHVQDQWAEPQPAIAAPCASRFFCAPSRSEKCKSFLMQPEDCNINHETVNFSS